MENQPLADLAVAGDDHTPYFENTPWSRTQSFPNPADIAAAQLAPL